jgi:hypothetical protein
MVISEGQERVMQALEEKTAKAIELYSNLVSSVNNFREVKKEFNQTAKKPAFL